MTLHWGGARARASARALGTFLRVGRRAAVAWPRQDFLDFFFEICGGREKGKISKKFAGAGEEICKARNWDTNSCVGLHSRSMFVWDSCFAATHVSAQWVDDLAKVKPLGALADLHRIKARLPIYRQRAANFTVNYRLRKRRKLFLQCARVVAGE